MDREGALNKIFESEPEGRRRMRMAGRLCKGFEEMRVKIRRQKTMYREK